MSQNMCGEFTQRKTPKNGSGLRNLRKLMKIIVHPKILQDIFGCSMQWHTLPTFLYAFPTKMTPLGLPWTLWLNQLDLHLVHAAHYCRETQWWRYDPWKLHVRCVFVDGKFQDSGAQGVKKTCLQHMKTRNRILVCILVYVLFSRAWFKS